MCIVGGVASTFASETRSPKLLETPIFRLVCPLSRDTLNQLFEVVFSSEELFDVSFALAIWKEFEKTPPP